ncbi:MAG: hypothetical protein RBT19_10665, partial [Tenuifilaceae bacterium]|nr:hypothetical protein [Tenuifilaceae bacterium]
MKNLYLILLLGIFSCISSPNLDKLIDAKQIEQDILVLASDSLQGRAPLSVGEQKTLAYLEERMIGIGLDPAFGDSYLQEVPLAEISSAAPKQIEFSIAGGRLSMADGEDYTLWSPLLKDEFTLIQSELVFAGFGIDAPEYSWNDFEGI